MLKIIFILLIVSFNLNATENKIGEFLGSKTVQMPSWFKTSFLDFSEDVADSKIDNKHLILYFHQDGCPYCAKLVEENFTDEKLVTQIRQNFEIIDVNMWGDKDLIDLSGKEYTEKQFAEKLKIQFTPSLIFLDTTGKQVLRMDGYQSISKMSKMLDFVATKKYQTTTFSAFSSQGNNGKLNSQNFFSKPPHMLARSSKYPANDFLAVFFEEGNCPECDDFHNNMLTKNNIKSAFEKMEVVQLNTSKDEKIINTNGKRTTSKKWYQELKLTSKPAVVIFDKFGVEIIRKDGFFKEFHFDSILQYALTSSYKTQSNFQRYIEHRADEIRATGVDVDLWK